MADRAPELKGTTVLALPTRRGLGQDPHRPPKDDEEDYASDVWAGDPLRMVSGEPIADERLREGIHPSEVVTRYRRPKA